MKSEAGNIRYTFEGTSGTGYFSESVVFQFDAEDFDKIKGRNWYPCLSHGRLYMTDRKGQTLHSTIMGSKKGMEIDHINLDTLDNRKSNLRYCTHQQNQINQPKQKNNTSGFTGVRFYPPRNKYVARLKLNQVDIHLGYYPTLIEAVQARNVGMRLLFGEYAQYDPVAPAPLSIYQKVFDKCIRFSKFSHGDLAILN